MSKNTVSLLVVSVLVSLVVGFAIGRRAAAPGKPPAPRGQEELARSMEERGELRGILLETNVIERARNLADHVAELGPEDVPAVAGVLRAGASGLGSVEAGLLTRYWAMYEPEAAAEWAFEGNMPKSVQPVVMETAMEAWAIADPQAALAVAQEMLKNTSGAMSNAIRGALVRGWFLSGEPGLLEYIRGLQGGYELDWALETLVNELVHRDGIEAGIAWLETFPTKEDFRYKRSAARALAPVIAQQDLERALEWCAEVCDKPWATHTRSQIARVWAQEGDPRVVIEWISEAPAGIERDRALRDVYDDWFRDDKEAVLAWIDQHDPDTVEPWFYELAIRIAVLKSFTDPIEAYRWAEKVPDPERRELAKIDITRRYAEMDEAAAEAWLAQSDLSDEAKEKAHRFPKFWHPLDGGPPLKAPVKW